MTQDQALSLFPDGLAAVLLALSTSLARPRRADPISLVIIAAATGLAGGALRDILLGAPVDFVRSPFLTALALAAGGVGVAFAGGSGAPRAVVLLDAGGLGILAAAGCAKAGAMQVPPLDAVLIGALSGVAGGLLRDLAQRRAPRLFTARFYGAAAVLGACLFIGMRFLGAGPSTAMFVGAAGAFLLRLWSISAREGFRRSVVSAP